MLVQKNKLKTSTEKIPNMGSREGQSVTSSNKEQFKDGCSKNEQSHNNHVQGILKTKTVKLKNVICGQRNQ